MAADGVETVLQTVKTVSGALAIIFVVVLPCWYVGRYFFEPLNPYRQEYLQGAYISLVMLSPGPVVLFFAIRAILRERS